MFVQSKGLCADGKPVLLAVSGGVDSVVMAHLFQKAGLPFGIAHCNFMLRGEDSDQDEMFVRQLASGWGADCFVKHFETKTYAEKTGLSIQMAARDLRYGWFGEIAADNGFYRIATAHNLNDSVETALLNFTRGTGLSGLKGIATSTALSEEKAEMTLIRPMLFATRAEIESFALDQNIIWREDSSNRTDEYARNYLRHRVLPLLEALNPNFLHTATRNLDRLRETDENLQFLLREYFFMATPNEYSIDKQKLARLPAPRRAMRELLKTHGFTEEQTRQIAGNLDHIGLRLHSAKGWLALIDRDKILLERHRDSPGTEGQDMMIRSDDLLVALPDGKRLVLMHTDNTLPFPDGRASVLLDAGKVRFPLTLRPWRPGDYFQPFGMEGRSQKLQDFFTNLKLSRVEKEKTWVLENADGAIIWVVGYRLDERFRVIPATRQFLKISYL